VAGDPHRTSSAGDFRHRPRRSLRALHAAVARSGNTLSPPTARVVVVVARCESRARSAVPYAAGVRPHIERWSCSYPFGVLSHVEK
jgi:hypothetical protein